MSHKIVSSILKGYYHNPIWSHVRDIYVSRYKDVVIFDIPYHTEKKELGELVSVIKDKYGLKITYSVKETLEPEREERYD